jgi:hypothetical protein
MDRRDPPGLRNLLLEKVEYRVTKTSGGTWRRFLWPTGELFEEYVSDARFLGLALLHVTRGRSPETGRRVTARGVIAVGRKAVGVLAIGQASAGVVAIGQASAGLLLGIGQATCGIVAVGQLAVGLLGGFGQLATGWIAVGQLGLGEWVLAQVGFGAHVWDTHRVDPAAEELFRGLLARLGR